MKRLVESGRLRYASDMSAAEIIEQIKALPAEEKALVAEFLRGSEDVNESKVQYVDREKARVTASRIFEENAPLFRKLAE